MQSQSYCVKELKLPGNILVIGSNSFSGSSFVNFALNAGKSVIGVSRQEEVSTPYAPYLGNQALKNFTFYRCDLNDDAAKIAKICADNQVTSVVNFAAQSMVGESWTSPIDWYQTNVVGLARLIQELDSAPWKIDRFLNFTTPEVYGSTNEWIKESFDFSPTTPYAISRAASDFHLRAMYQSKGFPVLFTRAANVYGEYQRPYRIVPRALIAAMTKKRFPLHGGGHSLRSFIHIDDVSHALLRILEDGKLGESYHISTNQLVSIREVVSSCANLLGMDLHDVCDISDDRIGKDAAYKLESSKIRAELGWIDSIDLDEGLRRTLDWVKKNLNTILASELEYVHRR
jgi:dTDP-glucose 4,6-dehydratase